MHAQSHVESRAVQAYSEPPRVLQSGPQKQMQTQGTCNRQDAIRVLTLHVGFPVHGQVQEGFLHAGNAMILHN